MLYNLSRIINTGSFSISHNNNENFCEEGYKYILNNCVEIRNINEDLYFELYLIDFIIILFIIILIKKFNYNIYIC